MRKRDKGVFCDMSEGTRQKLKKVGLALWLRLSQEDPERARTLLRRASRSPKHKAAGHAAL